MSSPALDLAEAVKVGAYAYILHLCPTHILSDYEQQSGRSCRSLPFASAIAQTNGNDDDLPSLVDDPSSDEEDGEDEEAEEEEDVGEGEGKGQEEEEKKKKGGEEASAKE